VDSGNQASEAHFTPSQAPLNQGAPKMNRLILATLSVLALGTAAAPTLALNNRFEQSHRDNLNALNQRFEQERQETMNALNSRFQQEHQETLNALNSKFEQSYQQNLLYS
jgi:hypothetical protein